MADITLRRYDASKLALVAKDRYPRKGDIMNVFEEGTFVEDASPDAVVTLLRVKGLSAEDARAKLKGDKYRFRVNEKLLSAKAQEAMKKGQVAEVTVAEFGSAVAERTWA